MAKGGYRWNAGRPGWHVKAEHCLRIDARRWAREGMFSAGRAGAWVWRDADSGEETSRIGYCGEGGAVSLNFTLNGEPVRQHITTQRTACNYGGSRVWFSCPRCWRRVAVLFLRGTAGFIWRHCGRIAYGSQSDDAMGRGMAQAAQGGGAARGRMGAAKGNARKHTRQAHGDHPRMRRTARRCAVRLHGQTLPCRPATPSQQRARSALFGPRRRATRGRAATRRDVVFWRSSVATLRARKRGKHGASAALLVTKLQASRCRGVRGQDMKSISADVEAASALGRQVAAEKGLSVLEGETPTPYQAGVAALHAREDAAACMYLLMRVMHRQQTLQRWLYFVVFLLLCVLGQLK